MNIAELGRKSKELASRVPQDALWAGVLVLACVCSFGLGMLSERESGEGRDFAIQYPVTPSEMATPEGAKYVASKNGTRYHLPWCSGARSIAEANKIWFATKEEAEAAGYTPAANCKGI